MLQQSDSLGRTGADSPLISPFPDEHIPEPGPLDLGEGGREDDGDNNEDPVRGSPYEIEAQGDEVEADPDADGNDSDDDGNKWGTRPTPATWSSSRR